MSIGSHFFDLGRPRKLFSEDPELEFQENVPETVIFREHEEIVRSSRGKKITAHGQEAALSISDKVKIFYSRYTSDLERKPGMTDEKYEQQVMKVLPKKLVDSFNALDKGVLVKPLPESKLGRAQIVKQLKTVQAELKILKADCQRLLKEESAVAAKQTGFSRIFKKERPLNKHLTKLLADLSMTAGKIAAKMDAAEEMKRAEKFIGKDIRIIQHEVQKKVGLEHIPLMTIVEAGTAFINLRGRVQAAQLSTLLVPKTEVGLIQLLMQLTHFEAELLNIKGDVRFLSDVPPEVLREFNRNCGEVENEIVAKMQDVLSGLKKVRALGQSPIVANVEKTILAAAEEAVKATSKAKVRALNSFYETSVDSLKSLTDEFLKSDKSFNSEGVRGLVKKLQEGLKENAKDSGFCDKIHELLNKTLDLESKITAKKNMEILRMNESILIAQKAAHATESYIQLFGDALTYKRTEDKKSVEDSLNQRQTVTPERFKGTVGKSKDLTDFELLVKEKKPNKMHAKEAVRLLRLGLTQKIGVFISGYRQEIEPSLLNIIQTFERLIDDLPD